MRKAFEPLLEEFNQGREIDPWIQLHVDEMAGFQRVWSGGEIYTLHNLKKHFLFE